MSHSFNSLVFAAATAAGALLAPSLSTSTTVAPANIDQSTLLFSEQFRCTNVLNGRMFMRTELIFGMSRSNGPDITESEFQSFIDDQVTPRFPDGLTIVNGNGQFKDSSGTIVQERSKLLVLLYPFSKKDSSKVNAIRTEYQAMFQQQSVLRIDEEQCVSF